ncbi:hypothetical protein FB45DRAFT_686260, partial [Roridomyces roridus]
LGSFAQQTLLNAFRTHYHRFEATLHDLASNHTDAIVISRLGDDLSEFASMVAEATQNEAIFEPAEFATLQASLSAMQLDIRLDYQDAVDTSHHGRPALVQTVHTEGPGRPRIHIDPDFLRWAYGQRSTASIGRFLGVGRSTIQNALLEHGIVQPQANPFQPSTSHPVAQQSNNQATDEILDPNIDD